MRPVSTSDGFVSAGFAAGAEAGCDPPEGEEEQAVSANARGMIERVFQIMARNNTLSCYATVMLPGVLNLTGNSTETWREKICIPPQSKFATPSRMPPMA